MVRPVVEIKSSVLNVLSLGYSSDIRVEANGKQLDT